jgi:hypothetical protein
MDFAEYYQSWNQIGASRELVVGKDGSTRLNDLVHVQQQETVSFPSSPKRCGNNYLFLAGHFALKAHSIITLSFRSEPKSRSPPPAFGRRRMELVIMQQLDCFVHMNLSKRGLCTMSNRSCLFETSSDRISRKPSLFPSKNKRK